MTNILIITCLILIILVKEKIVKKDLQDSNV